MIGDKWSDLEYVIAKQIEILSYISNNLNWHTREETMLASRYSSNLIELFKIVTEERGNNTDFQHQIELIRTQECIKKKQIQFIIFMDLLLKIG